MAVIQVRGSFLGQPGVECDTVMFPKIMGKPPKSSDLFIGVGSMKFHNHPFWGVKSTPYFLVQHPYSDG